MHSPLERWRSAAHNGRMRLLLLLLLLGLTGCFTQRVGSSPSDDDDAAGDDDDSANPGDDDDGDDDDGTDDDDAADDDDDALSCEEEGATTCFGPDWMECSDAEWQLLDSCGSPTPLCDPDLGCLACIPDSTFCDGSTVMQCAPDGSGSSVVEDCAPDSCLAGQCVSACDQAEAQLSYLGCNFLAASTANIVDPTFDNDFAVVIGNAATNPAADVTVSRGGSVVATATVQPGTAEAITLPYVSALKNASQTSTVVDGAYEISTTQPVAAYQYNPLNFDINGTNSFTNDASLLLPEHVLTGNYMVNTWPTWGRGSWTDFFGIPTGDWDAWYPGFVAVVAVEDNTTLTLTSSTFTDAGSPGGNLTPGQSATVTLNRGDVYQLFSRRASDGESWDYCANQGWRNTSSSCPPGPGFPPPDCEVWCSMDDGDLTGTTVTSTQPLAVFGGHLCTFMPYDAGFCDHLEEMMFPTETWGVRTVMSAPVNPSGSGNASALYRVVALNGGTTLTFDPAVTPSVTLGAGEFVEFEAAGDFVIDGSGPFYATQTLMGQEITGDVAGDPAMGSGIPWVQVRSTYDFLTPSTYTANWVNVVAEQGASITLDGAPVAGFQAIGSTGFSVARVQLQPGSHHMESGAGERFGITTYGYAAYTSYLYPGGLNFTR
jgi:hypothetical protein